MICGGWTEQDPTKVDGEALECVMCKVKEDVPNAELDKVCVYKTQVVRGVNHEIHFSLKSGEMYKSKVWYDLNRYVLTSCDKQ